MTGVEILGKLHASGASPAVALLIDNSTLHRIDLRDARLRGGLAIENSVVPTLARFDSAQFDGPFDADELHVIVGFDQRPGHARLRIDAAEDDVLPTETIAELIRPDVEPTSVCMPDSLLKESLPGWLEAAEVAWRRPWRKHQQPQIKIAAHNPPAANTSSNNVVKLM